MPSASSHEGQAGPFPVHEICVFTEFTSLPCAVKGLLGSTIDGKGLVGSKKHLETNINSLTGLVLVTFGGSLLKNYDFKLGCSPDI